MAKNHFGCGRHRDRLDATGWGGANGAKRRWERATVKMLRDPNGCATHTDKKSERSREIRSGVLSERSCSIVKLHILCCDLFRCSQALVMTSSERGSLFVPSWPYRHSAGYPRYSVINGGRKFHSRKRRPRKAKSSIKNDAQWPDSQRVEARGASLRVHAAWQERPNREPQGTRSAHAPEQPRPASPA